MNFESLGLVRFIVDAVKRAKYEAPFPIQEQAIPVILKGNDVLGIAPTGSGKTAAYALPILQTLLKNEVAKTRQVRALIVVPTRELAIQVEEVFKSLSDFLPRNLKTMAVYGGVSINPQMLRLFGTEILIATPGRLLDLVSKNAVQLSVVEMLVLDEADQVLSLGFKDEVDQIFSLLPKKRQNILFSATTGDNVALLISKLLHNPTKVEVQQETITPDLINQTAYYTTSEKKGPLLRYLIKKEDWKQVLVFVSSKRTADNITQKLKKNKIDAMALHGDKSQGARTDALTKFKAGKLRVLVATDLAARGIDIKELPYVVNYELPRSPTDYIHRIGRTGRATTEGKAVSIICKEEEQHFNLIQKKMKKSVEIIDTTDFDLLGV